MPSFTLRSMATHAAMCVLAALALALAVAPRADAAGPVPGVYFHNNTRMSFTGLDGAGTALNFASFPGWSNGDIAYQYGHTITASNADGSNATVLANSSQLGGYVISFVPAGDYLYFTIGGQDTIARIKRDGTGLDPDFITGVGRAVYGLAAYGGRIYIADQGNQAIGRASLQGGPAETRWLTGIGGTPMGVGADGEHLYWTKFYEHGIGRANLDGSGTTPDFIPLADGTYPWGLGIDGQYVFWASRELGKIGRAKLDGTEVNTALATGATSPQALNVVPGTPLVSPAVGPPVKQADPVLSGTLGVDQPITATDGTWDREPTEVIRRWQVSAHGADSWTVANGPGALTSTYTPLPEDVGKDLRFVVQVGTGPVLAEASVTAPTVVPVPPAPVNSSAPTISGTPSTAAPLVARPGTWTGAGPITTSFQWQVSDDGQGGWSNAAGTGSTSATYVVRNADATKYHRVVVTARNGNTATAESAAVGPIVDAGPASTLYVTRDSAMRMARVMGDGTGLNADIGPSGNLGGWSDGTTAFWLAGNNLYTSTNGLSPRIIATGGGRDFEGDAHGLLVTDQYLYVSHSGGEIARMNRDGSDVRSAFITGTGTVSGLATDGTFIYHTDQSGAIGRARVDGGPSNVGWITGLNDWPKGVAVDGDHVYWTQYYNGTIGRANRDGSGKDLNFITLPSGSMPTGVGVDGRFIYWSDRPFDRVSRANLDGTNVVLDFATGLIPASMITVQPGPPPVAGAPAPTMDSAPQVTGMVRASSTLTADPGEWSATPTDVLYRWQVSDDGQSGWTDISPSVAGSMSANFTVPRSYPRKYLRFRVQVQGAVGGDYATAYSAPTAQIPVPPVPVNSIAPSVSRAPIAGGTVSASTGTWDGSGYELEYSYQWQVSADGQNWADAVGLGSTAPIYTARYADAGTYLRVRVTADNGSTAAAYSAGDATIATSTTRYVYFAQARYGAESSAIGRMKLDGAGLENNWLTSIGGGALGLAPSGGKLFWSIEAWPMWSTEAGGLGRSNLDGSSQQSPWITDGSVTGGMGKVVSLAIQGDWIYFSRRDKFVIGRVKTDGTSMNPEFMVQPTGHRPEALAADADHLYWCIGGSVHRADLDGGSIQRNWISNVGCKDGLAVNTEHIYWTQRSRGSIGRADIDGRNVNVNLINQSPAGPFGIAADDEHIYWTREESQRIARADVDGSNVVDIATVTGDYFYGIAVDPLPGGALPVNSAAPGVSGTPRVGSAVSGSTGTWSNSPSRYSYRWEVSANGQDGWQAATGAGAMTSSYTAAPADQGKYLRLRVRAWNGSSVSDWVASGSTAAVRALPPVNSAVPTISGTTEVGSTLTAAQGTWTGASSYTYQWQSSPDGQADWIPATGSGTATNEYTIDASDEGRHLRVKVTATGTGGDTDAFSTSLGPVTTPGGGGTDPGNGGDDPGNGGNDPGNGGTDPGPGQQDPPANDPPANAPPSPPATPPALEATPAPAAPTSRDAGCTEPKPAGTVGIVIADGLAAVKSREVKVAVVAPPCARTITISNSESFANARTLPIRDTLEWSLGEPAGGRRPNVVYARFGQADRVYSDEVILDGSAPGLKSARLTRAPGGVLLSFTATEGGSGLAEYQVAQRPGKARPEAKLSGTSVKLKSGKGVVLARVGDAAGNWSGWVRVRRG